MQIPCQSYPWSTPFRRMQLIGCLSKPSIGPIIPFYRRWIRHHTDPIYIVPLEMLGHEDDDEEKLLVQPVVFLHGGPGGGTVGGNRRFFDPDFFRIILFDQRGAGKSRPHACLQDNTTWDLVDDIEKLRKHLKIKEWQVFGGSWGSTLALAYAQSYAEHVTGMVLRGIFLLRKKEIDWFYEGGAAAIYPDVWVPNASQGRSFGTWLNWCKGMKMGCSPYTSSGHGRIHHSMASGTEHSAQENERKRTGEGSYTRS
eukprot:Gb_35788 [translate_table: standard]